MGHSANPLSLFQKPDIGFMCFSISSNELSIEPNLVSFFPAIYESLLEKSKTGRTTTAIAARPACSVQNSVEVAVIETDRRQQTGRAEA
jgi:hypothetical protein